ncbi:GNAT family N-acetyltransferase [Novipirellula sp.]|uniref:GNAT family N-acetyltransferase n=1 Tax=Novipirellula sp. TaxID=2795430 RepID=UPI00356A2CDA
MRSPINTTPSTDLRIDCVPFSRLSEADWQGWERLRQLQPEFASPFFSPAFIAAADTARGGDVEIAQIRRGDALVGLWAFHRIRGVAWPVGRCFNDAHNIIAANTVAIDWRWLLKELNLKAFHFHSLVGPTAGLADQDCFETIDAFSLQLGDDSPATLRRMEQSHTTLKKQQQKTRKMARELGEISLEIDCRDAGLLDKTIQLKREQYLRTKPIDVFAPQWPHKMLRQLFEKPRHGAYGMLSVLRAGDHLVAAHYGIREGDLLHYWFPVYDPRFAIYSPGTALFKSIVRHATQHGIRTIDMGYGEPSYKRKQTDTQGKVIYGVTSHSSSYHAWHRLQYQTQQFARYMPFKQQVKKWMRTVASHATPSPLS